MRKVGLFAALVCKKMIIGVFLLYIINVLINDIGLHISMNITTSLIAGFLGLPGIFMLAAVEFYIFK
jgi:inhibitor of the pro-sigma K processing machinery